MSRPVCLKFNQAIPASAGQKYSVLNGRFSKSRPEWTNARRWLSIFSGNPIGEEILGELITEPISENTYLMLTSVETILETTIALEMFRDDHGSLPRNLEELVPVYLPAVPPNPLNPDRPLRYTTAPLGLVIRSPADPRVDPEERFCAPGQFDGDSILLED